MTTLLLIDDDEAIQIVYREEFEDEGYTVLSAKDGETGLEIFQRQRPNIVILDILMPGMNGVDVLRQMKMMDNSVPVILSSAYQDFKRDLGTWASDAYVVKSGNIDELKLTVKELLGLRNA